jgi:UDP-2-acetamido-3-amino-2,3-dideoxy-glucuronate N-acetyltransferase
LTHPGAHVHAAAEVEADVLIGAGTTVWQRAQVRQGAKLGEDCVVGRDAFLDQGVSIGDRVKIQNGALIYHGVTIGDGVFIGPGAILTNDRYPRAITPDGNLASSDDWTVTRTHVGTGSSIGAGAVIVAGSDVGEFATVAAGAVVTRPVAPHALVAGNPARQIGWVCRCGYRVTPVATDIGGLDDELACSNCPRIYALEADVLVAR